MKEMAVLVLSYHYFCIDFFFLLCHVRCKGDINIPYAIEFIHIEGSWGPLHNIGDYQTNNTKPKVCESIMDSKKFGLAYRSGQPLGRRK